MQFFLIESGSLPCSCLVETVGLSESYAIFSRWDTIFLHLLRSLSSSFIEIHPMNRLLKINSIASPHRFGKRDAGFCRRFCRIFYEISHSSLGVVVRCDCAGSASAISCTWESPQLNDSGITADWNVWDATGNEDLDLTAKWSDSLCATASSTRLRLPPPSATTPRATAALRSTRLRM